MAFKQAQLDALDEALAEGVLVVEYQDKKVRYRSFSEMMRLRELMAGDLCPVDDAASGIGGTGSRRTAVLHKGLHHG